MVGLRTQFLFGLLKAFSLKDLSMVALSLLTSAVLFSHQAVADRIDGIQAVDDQFSSAATRLIDGFVGTTLAESWENSLNPWNAASYPMMAILDLGQRYRLDRLQFYAGEIPDLDRARVRFEFADQNPNDFRALATAESPGYDAWSPAILFSGQTARYIRVVFDTPQTRFNISEIEIDGDTIEADGPAEEILISGVSAVNERFSVNADRLVDALEPPGTGDVDSWLNPEPWNTGSYPMSALIRLDRSYPLYALEYFVGNLSEATANVEFEYSNDAGGTNFQQLVTVGEGHRWNTWRRVELDGQSARTIRIRFNEPTSRFNISELRLYTRRASGDQTDVELSITNGAIRYTPGTSTRYQLNVVNNGPLTTNQVGVVAMFPPALIDPVWACLASAGSQCPAMSGTGNIDQTTGTFPAGASLTYTIDAFVDASARGPLRVSASAVLNDGTVDSNPANNSATDTDQGDDVPATDQPRDSLPGSTITRAFSRWPNEHLSADCAELHDRYWVTGPEAGQNSDPDHPSSVAYQTWHPAISGHPETGEVCDFGHEHGISPAHAPQAVFELSGGWPAFGYAARVAGGPRHEDHVGHKVSVARFRAAIGNGGGSEPLYDAGFECDWLSKIHQGSYSMDAFSNHLHEYFLTLRCLDGLNANGEIDNTVVGTEFSIKVMYTYGEPDKFVEGNCSGEQTFPSSILIDPDGNRVRPAMQRLPIGTDKPNQRGFVCSSGVLWKNLETEVPEVDLWTELINIQRADGSSAMTVQPYYIIKNPARIIQGFDWSLNEQPRQVIRTIDLCYDNAGNRLSYPYCATAPDPKPGDWMGWQDSRSPFNGTLRAINFKSSHVQNAAGAREFCTTASGLRSTALPPCPPDNILQRISQFDNNWNNGRYSYDNRRGNIAGSIWAQAPNGSRFEAAPNSDGSFTPRGLGFEFVIDNREPDDDLNGFPDGANIRGEN